MLDSYTTKLVSNQSSFNTKNQYNVCHTWSVEAKKDYVNAGAELLREGNCVPDNHMDIDWPWSNFHDILVDVRIELCTLLIWRSCHKAKKPDVSWTAVACHETKEVCWCGVRHLWPNFVSIILEYGRSDLLTVRKIFMLILWTGMLSADMQPLHGLGNLFQLTLPSLERRGLAESRLQQSSFSADDRRQRRPWLLCRRTTSFVCCLCSMSTSWTR